MSLNADPQRLLRGRASECAALDAMLEAARAGESGVLVLRGEAGIGKTALLEYAATRSTGCRVVRAVGVDSEMELPFAAVHQLAMPLLDGLTRLPAPQRDALQTALGLSSGQPPDRLLLGLALLSLISGKTETRPLVCLVDDAQWLDRSSAQVLAFVARRLHAESVVVLFAERDGAALSDLARLPEMRLHGLSDRDAAELVASVTLGPLDESVRDRIVAEARGNPLALLELPRAWSSASLAGGFVVPAGSPVSGRIEASFRRRVARLPSETQHFLLVASADPVGDPTLLWRAVTELGIALDAAAPAESDDLLHVGARVVFRHPLLRSAIYGAASPSERRRAHRALASATDHKTDPDRRAWHRAHAALAPDEDVAAELERSAGRAQSRGGLAAAAAFLTRAAELTPDPAVRGRRSIDAAFASVEAGAFDAARHLLAINRDGPVDDLQRARSELVRAQLAFAWGRGNEATPLLLAAARRLEPLDLELALDTYLDALIAAWLGGRLTDDVSALDVARAARRAPRLPGREPTVVDLMLDAFSALAHDFETAVPRCRAALRKVCADENAAEQRPLRLWQGAFLALELWDDESWYVLSHRHLQLLRQTGRLSELPITLTSCLFVLVLCGELSAADSLVDELRTLKEATGIANAPYGALTLIAWRGRAPEARELIEVTIQDAASRGEGLGVAVSEYTYAVLCNGLGQYEDALRASCRATEDTRDMYAQSWGLTELIESATRTGRIDLAADALDRLSKKARASGTHWALGIEARSRAQLSDGDLADALFSEAIEHLSRTRVRAELARTHLLYGEWLRRASPRVDARSELKVAHEMFSAMGMEGFAERARQELIATGEGVRKRGVETRFHLTPQEEHIARLARDGRTNPEIGAELFISARTVEWHLRNVFTKLGVRSRRGLRAALPPVDSTAPPIS